MNFISLEFAVFVPIVFVLYWFFLKKSIQGQNILILIASYIFYAWWDWRFLALIILNSLIDYFVGLALGNAGEDQSRRKFWLYVSLFFNLGMLAFFKYFNFFIESFEDAFSLFGHPIELYKPHIILPIGISFYTLQTLSYTIDVYQKKIKPTKDVIAFLSYVSFFPQLVAGPIERATHLLPQFLRKRYFDLNLAKDGLRQILWGVFKKTVIADNILFYCMDGVAHPENYNGSTLFLIMIIGTIRIYCDFSAYSDIAIGTARLFGFDIMKNFDFPLFARNMSEFWQKWHISLITWIRDYIGRALGGRNKISLFKNIVIIFVLTGFWHGANWTYIVWGFLHALLFIPLIFIKRTKYRKPVAHGKLFPSLKEVYLMASTVIIFSVIGTFFENPSVTDTFNYYAHTFNLSLFTLPQLPEKRAILGIAILLVVEWIQREQNHGLDFTKRMIPIYVRWPVYYVLIFLIAYYGGDVKDFIYFQF